MRLNVTDWSTVPVVMDIPLAARIIGQTPERIRKKCINGQFPAYKEGSEWRIEKELLIAYMRSKCVMKSVVDMVAAQNGE